MRYVGLAVVAAVSGWGSTCLFGQGSASASASAPVLTVTDATIGQNLEASAMLTLRGTLPPTDMDVTVTSNDPSRLVLSTSADSAGSPSIVVKMRTNAREREVLREMEVFLQALDKSGTATYTASASGIASVTGTVTLAPSGIVIGGPYGAGKSTFMTTTGAAKTKINVYTALLDPSLHYVARQRLAGGRSVDVNILNSQNAIGKIDTSTVKITGGTFNATLLFQPLTEGDTQLTVTAPAWLSIPAQPEYNMVTAKVSMPTLIVTEEMMIGRNLQDGGIVGLNEPAPAGGLEVTLTLRSPGPVLFTPVGNQKGTESLKLKIPAGGVQATYYVQSLASSGQYFFTASAPGYHTSRPGKITLTFSGVVVTGPLSFTRAGGSPGFVASLGTHKPTIVTVYTVFLEPVNRRSSDVTVQQLRGGFSLTVELKSSDPTVGTIGSSVTIRAPSNEASTNFIPLKVGTTIVSVVTPEGYTPSTNATTLKCIVTE